MCVSCGLKASEFIKSVSSSLSQNCCRRPSLIIRLEVALDSGWPWGWSRLVLGSWGWSRRFNFSSTALLDCLSAETEVWCMVFDAGASTTIFAIIWEPLFSFMLFQPPSVPSVLFIIINSIFVKSSVIIFLYHDDRKR